MKRMCQKWQAELNSSKRKANKVPPSIRAHCWVLNSGAWSKLWVL